MINTFEEALAQNKRLVAEAFRVTQLYRKTQEENQELKKQIGKSETGMNPSFNYSVQNNDQVDLLEKLSKSESALKDKDEINKNLSRLLKETEQLLADAERRAQEAYAESVAKENFNSKSNTNGFGDNGQNRKASELETELQVKEEQLTMISEELLEAHQLLEDSQKKIQRLNQELLLLFDHSQALKSSTNECENMKQLIAMKDKDLEIFKKCAQEENHNLAEVIHSLENKMKADDLELRALKLEVHELKIQLDKSKANSVPTSNASSFTSDYNTAGFMNQVMENMNKMQLEIQRLNQQQNLQNHKI